MFWSEATCLNPTAWYRAPTHWRNLQLTNLRSSGSGTTEDSFTFRYETSSTYSNMPDTGSSSANLTWIGSIQQPPFIAAAFLNSDLRKRKVWIETIITCCTCGYGTLFSSLDLPKHDLLQMAGFIPTKNGITCPRCGTIENADIFQKRRYTPHSCLRS